MGKELKNIVLIGMSGVGKTVIGKYISKKNNMKLLDIDDIIANKINESIARIFSCYGDEYFRKLERKTIEELSLETNAVISTGGGAVLDQKNIYNLRKNASIFLLEADLETLIRNVKLSEDKRPLLEGDFKSKIKKLSEERKELYHLSADYIIRVDNKSIEDIGDEIIDVFKNKQEEGNL